MTSRTRSLERSIRIAAPIDAVWKALTDADELTRWFPPVARVEPGEGGRVWRRWPSGEDIQERIDRWVPNAHLRTVGLTGVWKDIVTDYHLSGGGGETILRVVSSGFAGTEDWDDLYEAFGGGWDFELRGLRHYLERHTGIDRRVILIRASHATSADDGWRRIMTPGGWVRSSSLTSPAEGDAYIAELSTAQRLSGRVAVWQPPRQFAASVVELNDAFLRIDMRCIGETGTPLLWLSTYGLPADVRRRVERDWQAAFDAAFADCGDAARSPESAKAYHG